MVLNYILVGCPWLWLRLALTTDIKWRYIVIIIREIKHHIYGKREFVPRDQVFHLLTVYCSLQLYKNCYIHANSIGSITIVLSCFYLLISHFETFSTGISRLPFAVNAILNLSNRPLALRGHVTNASFKQCVGILLMPKIDRAHKKLSYTQNLRGNAFKGDILWHFDFSTK